MANVQIYQMMVRHFGNTNETRKRNGTMLENGCGKFHDITAGALSSIRAMGFSHVWFTGVIEHISGTAYPERPADDSILLKGIAGSPYAIKDYFDVCPDYAESVPDRLEEFEALLQRTKDAGLVAMIDFVPNHVARSYSSDVCPHVSFGRTDDQTCFFHPDNNFFYLEGKGPLRLPAGEYEPEREIGKVTGNNAATWHPSCSDWYETIKLNYGHDYRCGADTSALIEREEIPDTWQKMDQVIAYWQQKGVSGFRCDMAHMVPVPFWQWLISKARARDEKVYFTGEAYDLDPAKLSQGNILHALLEGGFDSVYDSETYDVVKAIYEGQKWANDIDEVLFDETRLHHMLRYVENHDEVRVASPQHWGGYGANVGKAACAILLGLGRGANLIYAGQEVAEPALGSEGFSSDDGRTSIFDYWCCPELAKWVNHHRFDGGRLDSYQTDLRQWYSWWLNVLREPAFSTGKVYGLNGFNLDNPHFGRVDGEQSSGHWLYAYLRYTPEQSYLVVVNLHPIETLVDVVVRLPADIATLLKIPEEINVKRIPPCDVKLYGSHPTKTSPTVWD